MKYFIRGLVIVLGSVLISLPGLAYTPEDPLFGDQWALQKLQASEAWDYETANQQDVIIAVLDTGVFYDHPDLKDNMWDGSIGCRDENNNVIIGGCPHHGWDYLDNDNDPWPLSARMKEYEKYDHGTVISGVLASVANTKDIVGISSKNNVKIMGLRIVGGGTAEEGRDAFLKAVKFAKNNGAKILSVSYVNRLLNTQETKDLLSQFPGLIIAAAGNDGQDHNSSRINIYPCDFHLENVICVAATQEDDNLVDNFWDSDFGSNSVDIAAPGIRLQTITAKSSQVKGENFESVNIPDLPDFFLRSGNWGTRGYDGSNALVGDTRIPYGVNSNQRIISSTVDLSGANFAYVSFKAMCDTEYTPISFLHDYLSVEFTKDDVQYKEIVKFNEHYLDSLNNETPMNSAGYATHAFYNLPIPSSVFSNQARIAFRWVTDNDLSGGGNGCGIDDVVINRYVYGTRETGGTSLATPYVAGVAAMIWSKYPQLIPGIVKQYIIRGAENAAALVGKLVTSRRINLYNSLVGVQTNPKSKQYNPINVGQESSQTFTLFNRRRSPNLGVFGMSFLGANPTDFIVRNNTCSVVPLYGSCTFDVVFKPQTSGLKSATLQITHNDLDSVTDVLVSGTANTINSPPNNPPEASCAPPILGVWILYQSCTMTGNATAPDNVVVMPGAVLTIPNGITLRMDLKRNNLTVKKGGGVLIKQGGALKQK